MSAMGGFRELSIRRRLTLVTMLASGAALVSASAAFIAYDVVSFRQAMASRLGSTAEILAYNATSALEFRDEEAAARTLAPLEGRPHIVAAAIYAKDGRLFASYRGAGAAVPLSPGVAPPAGSSGHRFESDRVVVWREAILEGEPIGGVLIEADFRELDERLRRYAGIVALVSVASFFVALVVASRLQQAISGPILQLADVARAVSRDKDYAVRASVEAGGELGLLTRTFNEMLAEIQERDRELSEARADLERRVEARTSDLKSSEEQVRRLNQSLERRAKELEAANKELEAFSYSVSHDLRSPLRAIDGFSLALLEDYGEKLDSEAKGHLQRVRAAAQRMAQLIDDMLKLARITRAELVPQRVDLSAIAHEVSEDVRLREPQRAAVICVEEGLEAEGDPRLLRVALENLIGNAWKFTRQRAEARIEFGARHDGGGPSTFFVRDNGAGFDMAYADKLFGAFQRLHTTRDFEGTGIGLATVARVVHRHGGRVWGEGAVDQGATFYFTLTEAGGPAERGV